MNKRIRELAAQADEYATEKAQDGFSNYNLVYDRKFAELIVRECLDEIQYDDGATHVDELLPKHFGFKL